jgi:hypothetical protein
MDHAGKESYRNRCAHPDSEKGAAGGFEPHRVLGLFENIWLTG